MRTVLEKKQLHASRWNADNIILYPINSIPFVLNTITVVLVDDVTQMDNSALRFGRSSSLHPHNRQREAPGRFDVSLCRCHRLMCDTNRGVNLIWYARHPIC